MLLSLAEHGTIGYVAVILIIVAVVIVGGVAAVAMGRGGEMAQFAPDAAPLKAEFESAADVALLRPPAVLWGYDKQATADALNAVARTVTQRDVEIAALRQQIADMRRAAAAPGADRAPAPGGWPGPATADVQGVAASGPGAAAIQPAVASGPAAAPVKSVATPGPGGGPDPGTAHVQGAAPGGGAVPGGSGAAG